MATRSTLALVVLALSAGLVQGFHPLPSARPPRPRLRAAVPRASEEPALAAARPLALTDPEVSERLMEVVSGGSGRYSELILPAVLTFAVHACIPFASLSGVLLDGAIGADLGLSPEQVVLGDSLVFGFWIPGAVVGGPVSDTLGRKRALLGFAVLAAVALGGTGAVQHADQLALLASRALAGFAVGGFMSPAYTLLIESVDSGRAGRTSVSWSVGYVCSIVLLAVLHLGVTTVGSGVVSAGLPAEGVGQAVGSVVSSGVGWSSGAWRVEQLLFAGWVLSSAALVQALVVESPRYLLSNGDAEGALDAARAISRWNDVDLDAALGAAAESESALLPLAVAADACEVFYSDDQGPPAAAELAAAAEACSPPADEAAWADLFSAAPGGLLGTTLTLAMLQVAFNVAYYALAFSAGGLSDALLLNFVLLAIADLPGSTVAGRSCDEIGARPTALRFVGASGAALLLLAALGAQEGALSAAVGPEAYAAAATLTSLLGKTASSGAFTAVFCLTSESYPTKLRTVGIGVGTMFGKIGAAVAPPLSALLPLPTSLGIGGCFCLAAAASTLTLAPAAPLTPSPRAEIDTIGT